MNENLVDLFNNLADEVTGHPNFQFFQGGGIDILHDDRTHHSSVATAGQCDSSGMTLDIAVVNAKVDGIETKVDGIQGQISMFQTLQATTNAKVDGIEDKINSFSATLEEILERLNNTSTNGGSGSSQSQVSNEQTNGQIILTPSNAAVILAIGALAGVIVVLAFMGIGVVYRRRKQDLSSKKKASQIRRTGDFAVSSFNPAFSSEPDMRSGDLHTSAYNPTFSPHPVFSNADA